MAEDGFFRDVLHAHPAPTLVVSIAGELVHVNAAALERLGGSPRGRLDELPWAGRALQLLFDAALGDLSEAHGDVDLGPAGGRAAASASPILGGEGTRGVVIRLGAREEPVDLEALAAGLAHEIKNPLAGLKGAAELMQDELDPASPLRVYTGMIVREASRVDGLVQALLDLTKPPALERRPENLHSICEEVLELASSTLPQMLKFERRYDPSLPEVEVDRAALVQVLLNLILNAAQAMEGREGPIEVETSIALGQRLRLREGAHGSEEAMAGEGHLDREFVKKSQTLAKPEAEQAQRSPSRAARVEESPSLQRGQFFHRLRAAPGGVLPSKERGRSLPLLRLAVRDRGPGLPSGVELFTPFVTTRRGGTGLGLVIARRIVEAHGGRLQLRDRAGGGAEAEVLLPWKWET